MKRARFIKVLMVGATLLVGLNACQDSAPAQPEQANLKITGMHCESCAEGITRRLRHTKGISATDVHFSNEVQKVNYDAARLDLTQVISVITNLGFQAEPVSAPAGN